MASRVAVMYAGQIVEEATFTPYSILQAPYTVGLIGSVPVLARSRTSCTLSQVMSQAASIRPLAAASPRVVAPAWIGI